MEEPAGSPDLNSTNHIESDKSKELYNMNSLPYFHAELRVNLAILWRDLGIQRLENL